MGKIILMVLGLAVFGAHTLVERFAPDPSAPQASALAEPQDTALATGVSEHSVAQALTESAVGAVLNSAGLSLQAHPSGGEGCGQSILSAAELQELMRFLPPQQQEVLAKVLNTSAPIWSAQLYMGHHGYGMCLPMQDKVLLLPQAAQQQVEHLVNLLPR